MGSPDVQAPSKPAFDGAPFDKKGFCINHGSVQLANPSKSDGKLIYDEIRRSCPKCVTDKNKSKKGTSISGGRSKKSGHMHGTSSSADKSSSKPKKIYDTPFDEKGRCHYHKSVQLANKKMGGGWKILQTVCPKCMEQNYIDGDDDRSVKSGRSTRSARSVRSTKSGVGGGDGKTANGEYDKNGCCVLHPHMQVAKKKVLGGWKVIRPCPVCEGGEDIGLDDDRFSVCSGKSAKSTRSTKSNKSSKKPKSKPGQAQKSGRYGQLPFDGDGYCCVHPSVQIAKKKALGGWKIIHDVCPDCKLEKGESKKGKKPRRKSGTGRTFDADGSENSSVKSSSSKKKKKVKKVKNFKTEDENGKPGKYTGEVNSDYKPNGQGSMKYEDGTSYEGVWCDGSQVHGKMRRRKSKF